MTWPPVPYRDEKGKRTRAKTAHVYCLRKYMYAPLHWPVNYIWDNQICSKSLTAPRKKPTQR